MLKNFNDSDNIVLTSQNKENIFVFKYNGANRFIVPTYDTSLNIDSFYINGIDLSKFNSVVANEKSVIGMSSDIPAVFHIATTSVLDYEFNLKFNAFETIDLSGTPIESFDVSIYNRPFIINNKDFNLYPNDKIITDNESSYLVLRTNPKFTGNIKLVVGENDDLFLDTFKVSDILSNKKYRKQQVSGNSSYSSDVRNVFSSIPIGELYKVDKQDTLDIALPKTSLHQQFNTTYNYGSRLFSDDLYSEDYSILAPLWINNVLPDFFSVFRLDGTFNEAFYNEIDSNKIIDLASKYLKESVLLKSWSINQKKNLGKYLHNYLGELNQNQFPVYLPLTTYDHNVWNGISVKSGIISSSQETSYQFEKNTDNFTNLNAFISNGFERNNLLCPNLLNLEYAFNDNNADMYSMHRYFGLYLSENILYNIFYHKASNDASLYNIIRLDGSLNLFNEFIDASSNASSAIFNIDGSIHDIFKNRIFTINYNNVLDRISNVNQLNDINKISKYCNKPGDNIFSTDVVERNINQFISVKINNLLKEGDHLRVINKTLNIIWEIYGISVPTDINLGSGILYNTNYNELNSEISYPRVYRTVFNIGSTLDEQLSNIKIAFNSFSNFEVINNFRINIIDNDSFSILIDSNCDDSFMFQHITSQRENGIDKFTNVGDPTYLSFFGMNDIIKYSSINFDDVLGPINFEYYGNRNAILIDFVKTDNNLYSINSNIIDKFQPYMYYQNTDKWYDLIETFDISTNAGNFLHQYIKDPESIELKYLIKTPNKIAVIDNKLYAYSVQSINVSLMGINSVKDFDFNVYDFTLDSFKSEYASKRENDKLSTTLIINNDSSIDMIDRNSYLIVDGSGTISSNSIGNVSYSTTGLTPFEFNTFNESIHIDASTDTQITYSILDGSINYIGYANYKEENIISYFDSSTKLKYSLTSPYVTKWVMNGLDCRNNELLLSLKPRIGVFPEDASSNFIPIIESSIFYNEISIPSIKYLSSNGDSWKNYIYYDINDVIYDNANNRTTIKQAILDNPYIDVFSKLIFSNKINKTYNKSSIFAYNKYKNSIDAVFSGLKLSIRPNKSIIDVRNIENYNKYKFSFISSASRNYNNNNPIEIFINENLRTILMVWYQGSDILSYHYRNSSFVSGKSFLHNSNSNMSLTAFNFSKDASIDNIINNFVKSPIWVDTAAPIANARTINSSIIGFYDKQISPLVQNSLNIKNKAGSVFVAYSDHNSVISDIFEDTLLSYFNASGSIDYSYNGSKLSVGNNVINHSSVYESNLNLYTKEVCDIKLLKKLLVENNIFYYILRKNTILTNNTIGDKPYNIEIIDPRSYKNTLLTHNGGYFPKFINILEFSPNEDLNIIAKSKKDFISSNTNLSSYNLIPQLWFNNVVSSITDNNVNGRNVNYVSNYNVFKSLWDKEYYNINEVGKINGYASSFESPSFFGSKLLKLPNNLTLSNWNNLNSAISYINGDIIIKLNMSLIIRKIFRNNLVFLSNWNNLKESKQYIDQYINDTVVNYYNISASNINVKVYSKINGDLSIASSYDAGMNELSNQNFSSELLYENSNYFYLINIKNTFNNMMYFIEIELTQK